MKTRDLADLIMLGILWGMSFMFIRVAAPEFGAVVLIEVRVVMAALVLLPLLIRRRGLPEVRRHWRPILLMGILHYAIPFCLFAYSMLTLTGGYSAIVNASSPLFAGAVAWAWMGERPRTIRVAGLLLGLVGVIVLVTGNVSLDKVSVDELSVDRTPVDFGSASTFAAIGAAVVASFFYGLAAVMARKRLTGVSPIAVSGGSMIAAAVVLLPVAVCLWPDVMPSARAWAMALALGVACTAIAFVLYFRLIANVGPTKAITVTFLIPVFAVLFGAVFIDEAITASMIAGGAVILLGTAMSTGLLDLTALFRRQQRAACLIAVVLIGLNDIPGDVHSASPDDFRQFNVAAFHTGSGEIRQ